MAETKSYMFDMRMEVISEDDKTVKAVRVHGLKNEPLPLLLFCDFLKRLGDMTPGEEVMLVTGEKPKPLVEKDKGYVLLHHFAGYGFAIGDIFRGVSDTELQHCRSGEVFRPTKEQMNALFVYVGDINPMWLPAAEKSREFIAKMNRLKNEG